MNVLIAGYNSGISRPAYAVALERVVQTNHAAIPAALASVSSSQLRAQWAARLDVRNSAELQALMTYLNGIANDSSSVAAFAASFPNANSLVSQTIYSNNTVIPMSEVAAIDDATQSVIAAWQAQKQWAGTPLGTALSGIASRLRRMQHS
jgi:hypothetical protein